MTMNFDATSLGLALRLIRHSIERYRERHELTDADAAALLRELDNAERFARSFATARQDVQASPALTASGKQAQLDRLIAQVHAQLAPLRELARELAESASSFEARADYMAQQPDGSWQQVPPFVPTPEDRDDWREVRDQLAGREPRDVRALYLSEVRAHGTSPITFALEHDPAERARPEPLIDAMTARRAQQLRRERSGVQQHLTRSFTAAQVAGDITAALERELGIVPPRPAPERVTA